MVLILLPLPGDAEIYRYRDATGTWVFSDRPPPGHLGTPPTATPAGAQATQPSAVLQPAPSARLAPGAAASTPAPPPSHPPSPPPSPTDPRPDLAARLQEAFDPVTPVEAGSLAVVTVHSELGAGSGFFVTDGGFLLTNRHVVRPAEGWAAEERAELAALKEELDALERRLSLPRDRFSDADAYDRGQRMFRERSREYRQAKRALEMKRNAALLQHTFDVQLKDGERLTAELVDLSPRYDLALLRVSDYRTPFIRPLLDARLRQTQPVYALGSSLGIKDTATAGTYAGRREDMLVTDARVLPGSSGGPLVTETGWVVGINTWKATAVPDAKARGFGVAIPIDAAFEAFPELRDWQPWQRAASSAQR